MTRQEIETAFKRVGIKLSKKQVEQFFVFGESVVSANAKASLISKKDEARILNRHFIESAVLSLFDEFQGKRNVLDLGTGGGFPGIPLKIICPKLKMDLLDAKQKKSVFLKEVAQQLKLSVNVFWGRAEEFRLQQKLGPKYDIVVSRAVARLPQLFDWAKPYLKPSGLFVAVKGSRVGDEITELKTKQKSLSIRLKDFPVTSESSEYLKVVFIKI